MWFEDLMLLALLSCAVFFIAIPVYRFFKTITPRQRNTLAEAKARLEQARIDVEAAHLNKQAEELYEKMYQESLQEEETIQEEIRQEKRK